MTEMKMSNTLWKKMLNNCAESVSLSKDHVERKDEASHGSYRTKEKILEIDDVMQRTIETGEACQTVLDPPPTDPRVAHPARR